MNVNEAEQGCSFEVHVSQEKLIKSSPNIQGHICITRKMTIHWGNQKMLTFEESNL